VLGASGYVGGRLVPRLLDAGYRVRCVARTPAKLEGAPWFHRVEIVQGDLLEPAGLGGMLQGASAVFHLVHSMGSGAVGAGETFEQTDRRIAENVAAAADEAGVGRIVYLGGLGEDDPRASAHLRSRHEVGQVLLGAATPTTALRAAIIIGSGSASFEMLRHLVERLPVMVTPRWVRNRVQPIAVRDVLRYLVGVAGQRDTHDHVYEIAGPDVLTYKEMMQAYARLAGLPGRLVLGVPVLSPRLSSYWVHFVTPVPSGIAQPLIHSLTSNAVATGQGEDITEVVPGACVPYGQALRLALRRIRDREVTTSWREADLAGAEAEEPQPGDPDWSGGSLLSDRRTAEASASVPAAFATVCGLGGEHGWPMMWAWRLRGLADRLVGGPGLRRGRRDPVQLRVGDAVDFWRVEQVDPPGAGVEPNQAVLALRAEMRVPGLAWLEFTVRPAAGGRGSELTQVALFAPSGFSGHAYWYGLLIFHVPIFKAMVAAIAAEAERSEEGLAATSSDEPRAPLSGPDGEVGSRVQQPPQPRRAG
jgi:uncharacterized protein YbjT (DUF2867 family)